MPAIAVTSPSKRPARTSPERIARLPLSAGDRTNAPRQRRPTHSGSFGIRAAEDGCQPLRERPRRRGARNARATCAATRRRRRAAARRSCRRGAAATPSATHATRRASALESGGAARAAVARAREERRGLARRAVVVVRVLVRADARVARGSHAAAVLESGFKFRGKWLVCERVIGERNVKRVRRGFGREKSSHAAHQRILRRSFIGSAAFLFTSDHPSTFNCIGLL
jgi:hypothetical protein